MPDVTYIEAVLRHEDAEMVEFHGGEAALARPTEYPRGAALGPTGPTGATRAEMVWISGEFPDATPRDYSMGVREQVQMMDQVARYREYAEERSRQLLKDHLNPEQRAMFEQIGMFCVRGSKTGTKYEIRTMATGNVWCERGFTYCAVLTGVPIYDQLLAQKLTIENNETEFLRVGLRGFRQDGPWAARVEARYRRQTRYHDLCEWSVLACCGIAVIFGCWGIYEIAVSLWKLTLSFF